MDAKLVVTSGKTSKRIVPLNLPAVLGRSREADVTVAHPMISRRHCELYEHDGLIMLRDLTSLNGTLIGGRKVSLAPLLPKGEFAIGPIAFRVMYEYAGDMAAVPEIEYAEAEPFAVPVEEADFDMTQEPLTAEQDDSVGVRMPDLAWADSEDAEVQADKHPPPVVPHVTPASPAAQHARPPAPAVPANVQPLVHPLRNHSVPRDKLPTVPVPPTPLPQAPLSPPRQPPAEEADDAPWAAGPPAHHHGPKPDDGDFGDFLEGLQ